MEIRSRRASASRKGIPVAGPTGSKQEDNGSSVSKQISDIGSYGPQKPDSILLDVNSFLQAGMEHRQCNGIIHSALIFGVHVSFIPHMVWDVATLGSSWLESMWGSAAPFSQCVEPRKGGCRVISSTRVMTPASRESRRRDLGSYLDDAGSVLLCALGLRFRIRILTGSAMKAVIQVKYPKAHVPS
ncbi:hypothetical protein N7462_009608 [Penicillium macrosclerotiorum]|uniref:uncharacterized protein n=1 Tax=Penicillium macrosclerotiorum TaxID=303699 RepID=UPI0025474AE9|nr:uncharacterized protein N7462_009608 [Penicillium macrosclerotiorum]KAJ5674169.1 hypothetical protein N7462_009608 [Penicillium macrosclerotiorum]